MNFKYIAYITEEPTSPPTPFPTHDSCEFSHDLDVVFVIDTSCTDISSAEWEVQQNLISKFVQKIKTSANPRLSLIACDGGAFFEEDFVKLPMSDLTYNNLADPASSEANMLQLYNMVRNCEQTPSDRVPTGDCVYRGMEEFNLMDDRYKKIVIISNCEESDSFTSLCWLGHMILTYTTVDIIIVNIGPNVDSDTNSCLDIGGNNPRVSTFTFDELTEEYLESMDGLQICLDLENEICEEPTPTPTTGISFFTILSCIIIVYLFFSLLI